MQIPEKPVLPVLIKTLLSSPTLVLPFRASRDTFALLDSSAVLGLALGNFVSHRHIGLLALLVLGSPVIWRGLSLLRLAGSAITGSTACSSSPSNSGDDVSDSAASLDPSIIRRREKGLRPEWLRNSSD